MDCHPSEDLVACAHIDGVVSVHRFCSADTKPDEDDDEEEEQQEEEEAATAGKGRHGEEVFSYLDYEEACRVVKFNQGE